MGDVPVSLSDVRLSAFECCAHDCEVASRNPMTGSDVTTGHLNKALNPVCSSGC